MFKDRLKQLLYDERLTQRAFAEKNGVPLSLVGFWLRGVHEPRLSRYHELVAKYPSLAEPIADAPERAEAAS